MSVTSRRRYEKSVSSAVASRRTWKKHETITGEREGPQGGWKLKCQPKCTDWLHPPQHPFHTDEAAGWISPAARVAFHAQWPVIQRAGSHFALSWRPLQGIFIKVLDKSPS